MVNSSALLTANALQYRSGSLAALFVLIGIAALLTFQSTSLLNDPDTYWHITVGQRIWETGLLPWSDEFSHTFAGQQWIAKEWLSQLLLYAAFSVGGWKGVVSLAITVLAFSFAYLFFLIERQLRSALAVVVVLFALVLSFGHFLARPHIFTYPLIIVWTFGLVSAVQSRSRPPWSLLCVLALWANLHASFPIALIIAGFLAAEAFATSPLNHRQKSAVDWGVFLALGVLATCVSPYGYHSTRVTLSLFGSGESLPYIAEWSPLELNGTGWLAIAAALGSGILLTFSLKQHLFRMLIVALLSYMMIKHVRFLTLFALVLPLLVARPLAVRLPKLSPCLEGELPRPLLQGSILALTAALFWAALFADPKPAEDNTPSVALAAARQAGLSGPVYNDYAFGGYLISQGIKTFIDGRSDQLFLGGFMRDLYRAKDAGGADFIATIERYRVTWALISKDSLAAKHFDNDPSWSLLHADSVARVYKKR